jgi:hypothetical protein
MPIPTPRLYATAADYQGWSGDTVTSAAELAYQLQVASQVIDFAATGAVYDTDATTLQPVDTDVQQLFCLATVQQVAFQIDLDDKNGVRQRFDSVSISGVAMHRTAGASGMALPPLGPLPMMTLFNAEVLQTAPQQGR